LQKTCFRQNIKNKLSNLKKVKEVLKEKSVNLILPQFFE
jgi:hypothetical protein